MGRLGALGVVAEVIRPVDRDGFRQAILDDPVTRQLRRAVTYETPEWGRFEQLGPLLRYGPEPGDGPRLSLPGIGEDTVGILAELGFGAEEIESLLAAKVARQLEA